MRTRVSSSLGLGVAVLGVVAALVGCARITQSGPVTTTSSSGDPTAVYTLTPASNSSLVYSARTVSFALDRIDQRRPPLDRTYRHAGTGKGVTVYVFDGGVAADHPELAGRVRTGFTGFPGDAKICNAHGTAVAGAVAGATLGVAPNAEVVDVKMVQCDKLRGTIKAIVDGARWVIEDHKLHPGPAVANWSFIADTSSHIPALDSAVVALREAGIAVVVSAGNLDIDACRVSPGNATGTIVVGASAVDTQVRDGTTPQTVDRRAPGTAWGSCIDIYAPGDSVLLPSLDRDMRPIAQLWNGTSMSAGYVSGAAALYLEAHPNATPDQVADALKRNATADVVLDPRATYSRMLYVGAWAAVPTERIALRR